jgi:hypothetical protein
VFELLAETIVIFYLFYYYFVDDKEDTFDEGGKYEVGGKV